MTSQRAGRAGSGRRPTAYRTRVLNELTRVLAAQPRARKALDFGAGDGWFAREMQLAKVADVIVPVDVRVWPRPVRQALLFDGVRLPFSDRAFDLVYAIDVFHHCACPERVLDEVLRCTSRYFLIKDHTYRNIIDWAVLAVLDELGNRRFAVPSLHRYQERWEWDAQIERSGFRLDTRLHPLQCHSGLLGSATNHLQFTALWRRVDGS